MGLRVSDAVDQHRAVRSRLQLSLPFASSAAAVTTSAATKATTTTTTTTTALRGDPPPVSRTRLLVDAIQGVLPGARIVIVDTRSVLLSQSDRDGVRVVRAHQMFLDADAETRRAVAVYLATGNRQAGDVVDEFVRRGSHLLAFAARPLKEDAHLGRAHDLRPLYGTINRRYFDDAVSAEIGWGQAGVPTRKSRRSITFGSYDHRARRITIHPVLDAPDVPPIVVGRIVHHEMLHAKLGEGKSQSGRRIVHSRQFRVEEATYEAAREADAWIDVHLDELLRWRR